MTPPSRTMSAARRIRRTCGFTGWTSKYWLTRARRSPGRRGHASRAGDGVDRPTGCSAGQLGYHTRPFFRAIFEKVFQSTMQFLFELAPVIAFVIAYVLGGIYVATATIMVAMAVMLAVDY